MDANRHLPYLKMGAAVCLLACVSCRSDSGDRYAALYSRYRPKPADTSLPTPDYSPRDALNVQLAVARTFERDRNWKGAQNAYLRILKSHPKSAQAAHRLAVLYDRQNRFEKSQRYFRQALKLQPGNADVFCDIGYSCYRQHRWADAEMNLKQAIKIDGNHARAYNHLGLTYAQMQRRKDALAAFRKAGCTTAQAHMNVALVLSLNDRLEDARDEYQLALNADPTSDEIRSRMQKIESVIARFRGTEPDGQAVAANRTGQVPTPAPPSKPVQKAAQPPNLRHLFMKPAGNESKPQLGKPWDLSQTSYRATSATQALPARSTSHKTAATVSGASLETPQRPETVRPESGWRSHGSTIDRPAPARNLNTTSAEAVSGGPSRSTIQTPPRFPTVHRPASREEPAESRSIREPVIKPLSYVKPSRSIVPLRRPAATAPLMEIPSVRNGPALVPTTIGLRRQFRGDRRREQTRAASSSGRTLPSLESVVDGPSRTDRLVIE